MRKIALAPDGLADEGIELLLTASRVALVCTEVEADRLRGRFEVAARSFEMICVTEKYQHFQEYAGPARQPDRPRHKRLEAGVAYLGIPGFLILNEPSAVAAAVWSLAAMYRLPCVVCYRGHSDVAERVLRAWGYNQSITGSFGVGYSPDDSSQACANRSLQLGQDFSTYLR
jgi:hypothetical protein